MDIYHKYIVTCEKKEASFFDKLLKRTQEFEIWSPGIINGFRDKINWEIYNIISIKPTKESMEVFWSRTYN